MNGIIHLLSITSSNFRIEKQLYNQNQIKQLSFIKNDAYLLSTSYNKIKIWNPIKGELLGSLPCHKTEIY